MRIRSIKPEVFMDEDLWDLEIATGLPIFRAFTGLWCAADKAGRFEWRPRILKPTILPHWDGDFSRVLDALATRGFLVRYACSGKEYGWVRSFGKHQVPNNKEKESTLPPPPELPNNFHELTRDARVQLALVTPLGTPSVEGEGEGEGEQEENVDLAVDPSKVQKVRASDRLALALRDARVAVLAEHYRLRFKVTAAWSVAVKHNGRPRAIALLERLEQGYTVESLKRAIDNFAASDWHRVNRQTDLELCMRNVDKWISDAPTHAANQNIGTRGRGASSPVATAAELAADAAGGPKPWET